MAMVVIYRCNEGVCIDDWTLLCPGVTCILVNPYITRDSLYIDVLKVCV